MNRFLSIIILSFFLTKGNAQGEWFSTAELDFIVPNRTEYNYSINNVGTLINLDSKVSLAVQYSINYQLFNKFSLGVLTGIQQQYGADIFMYKLGSNMKYYFVDSDNVYTYLQYASNFTVNKEKFKSGNNLRIGIGFPFLKDDAFNLNLNLFYEINHLNLLNSNPLVFGNEIPESIYFRSFAISLGIKF